MALKLVIGWMAWVVLLVSCTSVDTQEIIEVDSPASGDSAEPNLILGDNGILYLSWVEQKEGLAILNYSRWEGSQWSSSERIAEGRDWFVNWADYPAMAVNKQGDMIAHYLQMSDTGTYTYDIQVVAKKADADSWSGPVKLNQDTVRAEHGFVSMMPLGEDQFFLSWLDGRYSASIHSEEHEEGHEMSGAMTLRSALVSPDLEITNDTELDNRVCDCCQTTVVNTNNGPAVIYRDRSEEEVRDMSIVRRVEGTWTAPVPVHADQWMIAGCPVNGPKAKAKGEDLAIAWFTAANDTAQVNFIHSANSGASFGKRVRLDQGKAVGRVDIEQLDEHSYFVSWMQGNKLVGAVVNKSGEIVQRYLLASSSESRSSGFPQLALMGDQLMIAWTDAAANTVKTALFDVVG